MAENRDELCRVNAVQIIGRGKFGVVYKGDVLNSSLHPHLPSTVAIKVVRNHSEREFTMLRVAGRHMNVVQLFGMTVNHERKLVMHLCNGSLAEHLRESDSIELGRLIYFAYQIARGLQHIHGRNIVHSDLTANNVFLAENDVVKLGDFGLSDYAPNHVNHVQVRYAALEVLEHNLCTYQSDIWAYGVVIFEVFSLGELPYEDEPVATVEEMIQYLRSGERLTMPLHATGQIYEIMQSCWSVDPTIRMPIGDIVEKLFNMLTLSQRIRDAELLNSYRTSENREIVWFEVEGDILDEPLVEPGYATTNNHSYIQS